MQCPEERKIDLTVFLLSWKEFKVAFNEKYFSGTYKEER